LGAGRSAVASSLPLEMGSGGSPFSIEGRAYGTSGSLPQSAHEIRAGQEYFRLLRIPIRAGEGFQGRDFAGSTNVAMINETLARAFWPNESPLGKRILMGAPRPGAAWLTIVGIVGDIHSSALSRSPMPQVFRPFSQNPSRTIAVIADGWTAGDLERALRRVDAGVPPFGVQSMEERVADTIEGPRFRTVLFGAYGVLAFALAAFGVYSTAFYAAVRRRREFAVRSALGATAGRLFQEMMAGALRPAACGAIAGVAGGWFIGRSIAAMLFGVRSADGRVYLVSALLALAVAGWAAWRGGRRLLRIDPSEVLRVE
jgi:hypothetical protein